MLYLIIVVILALLLVVAWRTMHSRTPAVSAWRARLVEIDARLMDPQRLFSISETLAELDAIESQLAQDDTAARGHLLYLRSFVLQRAGRPRESLPVGLESLRLHHREAFLSPQDHGRLAHSLGTQAQELGEWNTAVEAYGAALGLLDADPDITEAQRLGARQRLGYCLHETGRYQEALEINRAVLAGGERLVGSHGDKLLPVITNLAQNAHALGLLDSARTYLERRLDIACRHELADEIDDSLFQLGVLAFEAGHAEQAVTFMTRRLGLARESGDDTRIADAQCQLGTLRQKLGHQAC